MKKSDLVKKFPNIYNVYVFFLENIRNLKYSYYSYLSPEKYPKILAKLYQKRTGKILDWNNLRTYTEKLQWLKLYDHDIRKARLTDKYLVREWVMSTIGEDYLIPLLGVWESFDLIDFDKLPNSFVLKTNNGSGTNLIVKDKGSLNIKESEKLFRKWMRTNFAYDGLELHYNDIKPLILAEKYMEDEDSELKDYKFLCFNGEVKYCWVDTNRFSDHRRNVYNLDWELQDWTQYKYKNTDNPIPKPKNFEMMIALAERLCEGFQHVRVDLYNVNGKIYFGEMTFTNGSGFELIRPEKYNLLLGELININ